MFKRNETKILTIDDDINFNKLLDLYLKRLNYQHTITNTIETFTKLLTEDPPHVCFVDMNLDHKSGKGLEMIETARKSGGEDLFIVIISGRCSKEEVAKGYEAGADLYLSKPINMNQLDSKIKAKLSTPE